MKFFISHKQEDASTARLIEHELKLLGIPAYLDVLDNTVTQSGQEMTEHIKKEINDCTDIIVIMSCLTLASQWVPFEIGIAAQRDLPTATFLRSDVQLPEFLEYWPRLKHYSDIRKYVDAKRQVDLEYSHSFHMDQYTSATSKTDRFYTVLKRNLL
jgi:hypothetical protein